MKKSDKHVFETKKARMTVSIDKPKKGLSMKKSTEKSAQKPNIDEISTEKPAVDMPVITADAEQEQAYETSNNFPEDKAINDASSDAELPDLPPLNIADDDDVSKDSDIGFTELPSVEHEMPMPDLDMGLDLEELDDEDLKAEVDEIDDEDIPILTINTSFEEPVTQEPITNIAPPQAEKKPAEEFIPKNIEEFYTRVLEVLYESEDMGLDIPTKARIEEAMHAKKLPQLIARNLILQKTVTKQQLAQSVARTQKRKEITSFLGVPPESVELRQTLDSRVLAILRDDRIIPLWFKTRKDNSNELHLAHETAARNLTVEAALREFLPRCKFIWHFAVRDVCGAYWLSGSNEDVDSSMEAEALLDRIIGNAIDARCSDIHIDPSVKGEFKAMIKYRIDGFVQSKEVITLDQLEKLRTRIENVARMPKVDLNHPNKGAFTRSGFDWRVQIQPHAGRQGPLPRIVIRRLQPDVMAMEQLGYPQYFIDQIKEAAAAPNGVLFWTGPTGSGKTESIHSAVVSVNPMGRGLSVHTIEDPPEKRVGGYSVQMEISEADPARSGLQLLKSSLRADPDVVIFGEVRDKEMADLVFEAANTGHLVFTTLHTNTALDAIVRLDEMGIYGFMVSYIRGIAAQRLVRRLCVHCREQLEGEPDEYTHYVFDKYGVDIEGAKLFKFHQGGCASCNHTGYYGRIAIAEWLKPSKELVELSLRREYENLESVARRAGWQPMGYMGVLHVKSGITDIAELSSKVLELAGENLTEE